MSAEDRSTEICGEKKGHNSHKVKNSKHNSEKMVKHKNTHPATCKTKKAGSQIANSKAPASQDDPVDSNIPVLAPDLQTTAVDQLGFQDRIYLLASVVFQNNHLEKPPSHRLVNYGKERGIALPEVKDEVMLRTAYELAFNTLKYQELLEDIMIDSCFYGKHPVPDDQMGLVAVMLYDFQDRKFLPRESHGEQEIIQEVRDVEKCLLGLKTKLAASLARCRIKHNLPSIECILPENVKMKQERSSNLPLYTWVNTLKSSLDEVQSVLKSAGFSQVKSIGQLEGQTFCQDPHCGDILVFPAQLKAQLFSTRLLSDHKLIIQDKSCSLGPNAVCSMLPEEGDVLMVGCFSGLTVSHTASLIAEKHKANINNQATVYVCVSDQTHAQREHLQQVVSSMGCKNVKLIPGTFQSLDSADKQLQKVRVILLTPKCSVSAVNNPVELILQENGDTDLLQDLSQGSIAQSKLEALVAQQRKDIDHALKFPKVLAVVYTTRSSYPEENEEVVKRALEQAKARSEQEGEPKQTNIRLSASPFSSPCNSDGTEETDHFFTLEPSEQSNGCFLAVLTREPVPEVKETTQEVLTRAFATGILDRIGCSQPTRKKLHGRNNRQRKPACTRITQSHTSASIQPKDQVTKGSNTPTLCGHQDFTNRQQTSQVKSKALRLEPIKTTVSSPRPSRKEASSTSSSSKTENTTTPKSFAPVCCVTINTTTSTTTTSTTTTTPPVTSPVHPAAPLTTPVVRHRRAQQEVLRPMVLVLPPVHIDSFFPPRHSQTKFTSRFRPKMWIVPTQTVASSRSSDGLFKDLIVKSRSLL